MLDILYALCHLILTPWDVYYYPHFRDEVTKAYSSIKTCLQHYVSGPPQFNLHSKYLLSPFSSKPLFLSNWLTTPPDMSSPPHVYGGCISQSLHRSPTTQVQGLLRSLLAWPASPVLLSKAYSASNKAVSTTDPLNLTTAAIQAPPAQTRRVMLPSSLVAETSQPLVPASDHCWVSGVWSNKS